MEKNENIFNIAIFNSALGILNYYKNEEQKLKQQEIVEKLDKILEALNEK